MKIQGGEYSSTKPGAAIAATPNPVSNTNTSKSNDLAAFERATIDISETTNCDHNKVDNCPNTTTTQCK